MLLDSTKITYRLAFAGIMSAVTVLSVVILLLGSLAVYNLRAEFLNDAKNEIAILANSLSKSIARNMDIDESLLNSTIQIDGSIESLLVFNKQHNVLYFYSKDNKNLKDLNLSNIAQINTSFSDFDNLFLNKSIDHNSQQVGYIVMHKNTNRLKDSLSAYLLITAFILVISIIISWLVVHRVRSSVYDTESKLIKMAHLDSVTGLYNRHSFNEKLQHEIYASLQNDSKFAVILIDLDDFKLVNDTLGHLVGDELLIKIGERLKKAVRHEDIVSRLGGDEFALIVKGVSDENDFNAIGSNIMTSMSDIFLINANELYISCSVGGAIYPIHGDDAVTLTQHADMAMYGSKNKGKNCVTLFNASFEQVAHRKSVLANNIRKGLDCNEFKLVYQPQFNLVSERIVGVEALIRWHSDQYGVISPEEFISIAEESGQIHALGKWIIKQALVDVQKWNNALKYEIPVAVNISTTQLQNGDIEKVIIELSESQNIPMYLLELEITESALMENVHLHIDTFKKLQQHGVGLSIDDFGTGYSSMSYLQRLPLDTLKIDKSFVKDIANKKQDVSIAKAIISLAHTLSLKVVAEGVETEDQAACLKDAECDIVQGFLYAKPMDVEDLIPFLKTQEELLDS